MTLERVNTWGVTQDDDTTWTMATWAPDAGQVEIQVADAVTALERLADGWFRGSMVASSGDPYTLRIDGVDCIDPAARQLSGGVAGPALLTPRPVLTPRKMVPRAWDEAALLEIHIGTFTREGTFAAAALRMDDLASLGITAIEIMPVAAFSGARGWGYDGVFPYAVHPAYGTPQDLADLVGAVQSAGMIAILDVVYNHFGPEGGSLQTVAPGFFNHDRRTPWGPAIDYTKPQVRKFLMDNALMWARDFGFDGFRLDAVHQIVDPSQMHLLDEMAHALRTALPDRPVHLIAEDDRNLPTARGRGTITANWNDDYHHAVHCLLTGENESYYQSYAHAPMEDLCTALADGHVEQGQPRPGRNDPRGAPSGHLPPTAFVNSNQTHDQVGNRAKGERLLTLANPEAVRIAHAMLLCAPAVPMLFMGEEQGARAPFLFFADFKGELGEAIRRGRAAEFAGFSQFGGDVPDPLSPETFAASRPYDSPDADAEVWRALTRKCLTFRARDVVPLLTSGRDGPAQVKKTGARTLHALWRFSGGSLEMVAHLGGHPDTETALENPDLTLGQMNDPFHFAVKATRK